MKQEQQTCIEADDSKTEIEYTCFNSQCKFCRLLCQQCKIDASQKHKSHIANKGDYEKQQELLKQSIRDAKFQIIESYENKEAVGAISNDLKYIVIGVRKKYQKLKILDYQTKFLIKAIRFDDEVYYIKFTDDSRILYVMTMKLKLYIYNVKYQFKLLHTYKYRKYIGDIYCVSNKILLTSSSGSSSGGNITKINVQQNKQLLKFKAHSDIISGLDYNKNLNIIVSGSYDKSIKLWNANNGLLLIEKYFNQFIVQVLFIAHNQLISLDFKDKVMIWNINYQQKQLQQLQTVDGIYYNIQIVLHQQFILTIDESSVKVYSTDGEFIRKFDHNLHNLYNYRVTDSIQACLLFGESNSESKQVILKIKLD